MTQVLKYVDNIAIIKYFKYYANLYHQKKAHYRLLLGNDHLTRKGGNIQIPNVAEKNHSDFGAGKKKSDSELLSYNLMLNSGKKNSRSA